jgi:protein-S-isoprenylcysteine O-methyltransferase Ste14
VWAAQLGLAGTLYAQLAMGESWRIGVDEGERTALVTGGPFAIVRNPIFSAMIPTSVGLTLIVPNVVALAGLTALALALEVQVRLVEEPYLRVRRITRQRPARAALRRRGS